MWHVNLLRATAGIWKINSSSLKPNGEDHFFPCTVHLSDKPLELITQQRLLYCQVFGDIQALVEGKMSGNDLPGWAEPLCSSKLGMDELKKEVGLKYGAKRHNILNIEYFEYNYMLQNDTPKIKESTKKMAEKKFGKSCVVGMGRVKRGFMSLSLNFN